MTTDGSLARYTLYPESCHAVDDHLMRGLYGSGFSPYVACGRAMCARCLEAGRVRAARAAGRADFVLPWIRSRHLNEIETDKYRCVCFTVLTPRIYAQSLISSYNRSTRDVKVVERKQLNSTSCPRMRQNPVMPLAGVLLHRVQPCTCTSAYKVIEQLADWQVYDSITPAAQ
jgi:hypothetical protein